MAIIIFSRQIKNNSYKFHIEDNITNFINFKAVTLTIQIDLKIFIRTWILLYHLSTVSEMTLNF